MDKKRKQEILNSRTKSIHLLYNTVKNNNFPIKAFVVASAIGYYGIDASTTIFTENYSAGNDFLAETCHEIESAAKQFEDLHIPSIVLRTGIVLTKKGGALAKIVLPINMDLVLF